MANLTSYASQAAADMADADVLLGANSAGTTKTFSLANLKTFLTTASSVGVAFSGNITPNSNAAYDLGTDALEWKDLWIDGVAYLDTVDIDAGAIDGTTIGANSTAPGSFTNILAVGTVTINGSAGSEDQILLKGASTLNYADHTINNVKDAIMTGNNTYLIGEIPTYPGTHNTAVGMTALNSSTSNSTVGNVAVGYAAGTAVTTGSNSTYVGAYAGQANTTGSASVNTGNTFVGYSAGYSTINGSNNTALGFKSLYSNTTGEYNAAFGYEALESCIDGDYNVGMGYRAGYDVTNGHKNVLIGYQAAQNVTTGERNIAIGTDTLAVVTTGDDNIAIGTDALKSLSTNALNTIGIGTSALESYTAAGGYSTAFGTEAGKYQVSGTLNTFMGYRAGYGESGVSGVTASCVYIGNFAGSVDTGGANNIGIGQSTLVSEKKGAGTTAIGSASLTSQVNTGTTTVNNTAVGVFTGLSVTTGIDNVFLGANTGSDIDRSASGISDAIAVTTGDYNTVLGAYANTSIADAQNQIVIGHNAKGHGNNIAVIGSTDLTAIHPGDDNGVDLGSATYSFKDAHVQGVSNLGSIAMTSTLEGNRIKVENVTANDTLTVAESGKTFVFNDADGATLTLPDSGGGAILGVYYNFFIAVTITSNSHKVVCSDTTNEKLIGSLHAVDADGDASAAIWNAQAGDSFSAITTDGVTKGLIGTMFTVTNMAADVWHVRGELVCTGTPATPFTTS